MTTPGKAESRRGSLDINPKMDNLLKEIKKISEKQDALKTELKEEMKTKHEEYYKKQEGIITKMTEEFKVMKTEIKEEFGQIRKGITQLDGEVKELKASKEKIEGTQKEMTQKIKGLDRQREKIELEQERLLQMQMDFQLRLRNIMEDDKEDIRLLIIKILADCLECEGDELEQEVDQVYRISSFYSRRNKTDRDVIVKFTRKKVRDDVLYNNNKKPIFYKGKKIAVLKEFPQATLARRRKYFFLTEELKKRMIRFRWERKEGIMVTYKEERYWLTTEHKAKIFYEKLMKEKEGDEEQGEEEEEEELGEEEEEEEAEVEEGEERRLSTPRKGVKAKKARYKSPKDYGFLGKEPKPQRMTPRKKEEKGGQSSEQPATETMELAFGDTGLGPDKDK